MRLPAPFLAATAMALLLQAGARAEEWTKNPPRGLAGRESSSWLSTGVPLAPAAVEFLQVHNDARARVKVPPLRWSETLARYAREWAEYLAATGTFRHRDRTKSRIDYGENLFVGSALHSPADAARLWLAERTDYRGSAVTMENLAIIGHYTQMVWSGTTEVGYGLARTRSGRVIVVGNYAPSGNRIGRRPY